MFIEVTSVSGNKVVLNMDCISYVAERLAYLTSGAYVEMTQEEYERVSRLLVEYREDANMLRALRSIYDILRARMR